jgi:ketosteroid isomerase-like protein
MTERTIAGGRLGVGALALLLTLAPAACGGEPADRGGSAFELELMAADRAFNQATQAQGVDGWVAFFDAQGAMIQPDVGEIRGLEAIRGAMGGLDDPAFSLTWEPLRAQGSADGTLGYTVGRYESVTVLASDTTVSQGLYVTIWRRQPDGSLRVVMDLGSPVDG